jgi:hypothetical protein
VFLNASSISSGFRGPTSGSSAYSEKKTQKYKDMFIGLRIIIGGTQEPIFWFLK